MGHGNGAKGNTVQLRRLFADDRKHARGMPRSFSYRDKTLAIFIALSR
jgi:hypothetical protein